MFLIAINKFFGESRFDNMASGGVLAIFYYRNPLKRMTISLKIFVLGALSFILMTGTIIGYGLDMPVAAILFAGLIHIIITKKQYFFLETKICKFSGKISYGLYMYHVIGILVAMNIMARIFSNFNGLGVFHNAILYSLAIGFTVLIATISYYTMEIRFLKLKDRFNKVKLEQESEK